MALQIDGEDLPQTVRIEMVQPPTTKKTFSDKLKDIGLIGIVGALLASLFGASLQYSRWLVEMQLSKKNDDFKNAITTFNAIVDDITKLQTLQESLVLTYISATNPLSAEQLKFLHKRASEIFPSYELQRMAFRSKINSYLFDATRYLDWNRSLKSRDLSSLTGIFKDPLTNSKLSFVNFDCLNSSSLPHFLNDLNFGAQKFDVFDIDWRSLRHQLIIFNYCFSDIHKNMEKIREWSALGPDSDTHTPTFDDNHLIDKLRNNVRRLDGISMLGLIQVERVRELNTPPGVLNFLRLAVTGSS